MNNYRQNFIVHCVIVLLTWILCMCIGFFVGPVSALSGIALFFWNWSVCCHWVSTAFALWYLYKWSNQSAFDDCMENMTPEARIQLVGALSEFIKKHEAEAEEVEEEEEEEILTNVGGTRHDKGRDEEGVYLLLDDLKLRNWHNPNENTEYYNLHIELTDYVTISIHAERALFALREKGIDYRFSVVLMAGEGKEKEFVVTYADDESVAALAEKVQEDTGFDTSDVIYGRSAEDAVRQIRKLRAYFADK